MVPFVIVPPVRVMLCFASSPTAPATGVEDARNIFKQVNFVSPVVPVFEMMSCVVPVPVLAYNVSRIEPVAWSLLTSRDTDRLTRPPENRCPVAPIDVISIESFS